MSGEALGMKQLFCMTIWVLQILSNRIKAQLMSSMHIITSLLVEITRQEMPFFFLKLWSACAVCFFWHIFWYLYFPCNYAEDLQKQRHCHSKRREDFKVCSESKVLAGRLAPVIGAHPSWLRSWFIQPKLLQPSVRASSWQLSWAHVTSFQSQRIYLCCYNNMLSWQRRAQALCELSLTSAILLLHQTSLSIRLNSSRGSSPLCTCHHPSLCCMVAW